VKKILILFIAVLFMMIGGCQKKSAAGKDFKSGFLTNDTIDNIQLVKEDALSNTNNAGVPETNASLTESISGPLAMLDKKTNDKALPEEPVVGVDKTKADKHIQDQPIEIPVKTDKKPVVKETKPPVKETKKGTYLKVGDGDNGQVVSRNKVIKITTVVFSPVKKGRYVDFSIFAIPSGKSKAKAVLLTHVVNIEVINGQAQFTRYWNGKNIDGDFIKKGKYNLFVSYTIKDADKTPVLKENRYWGANKNYYIRLN
jgi:hypothetical protein